MLPTSRLFRAPGEFKGLKGGRAQEPGDGRSKGIVAPVLSIPEKYHVMIWEIVSQFIEPSSDSVGKEKGKEQGEGAQI